ncbi:MAG: hypothetical protein KKD44_03675 [Proteobacteria bacterium]|nr:hypothetical protein [Pseudomonadota bacterium]
MDNQYMNFWQNAFTDMWDTSAQMKKMEKLVEQSLTNFGEFTSLVQTMGKWDSFKPMTPALFDFKKTFDEALKPFGLISIEEYRSLVTTYEELKKDNKTLEKIQEEQKKKLTDLNQAVSNEKKKLSTREKTVEDTKNKQDELKKLADSLKKDLTNEKKQSLSLQQELGNMKKLIETMKKEIGEKEKAIKKAETTKA